VTPWEAHLLTIHLLAKIAARLASELAARELRRAIDHAIEHENDGIEWLQAWREGDPEAMAELLSPPVQTRESD
jgi:hypothetical protein